MKNVGHIMSKYTNNNMAADTENKAFHGTGQGKQLWNLVVYILL